MLYQFWWRKKKVNFIIPPTYFRKQDYSISEVKLEQPKQEVENAVIETPQTKPKVTASLIENQSKISALSLSGIKARKELIEQQKGIVKPEEKLPSEFFTETQMLEFWDKYADRLSDKGHKIMESLLRINEPKLDHFIIT